MAQINLENLTELRTNADKIFLEPDGEKVLIQLLEIQKQVEDAIEEAKQKLAAAALKLNPDFTSIQSDKIKVYYRSYGQKYYIDEAHVDLAPKELYTTETKVNYKIDGKAVEKWVDEHGGMPTGITEVERPKTLSFSLKNGGKEDE